MCDPFYSRYAQTEELTSQVEDNHATRLLALISCVPHSATGKLEGAAWDDLIATCFKAINTGCEGNGDNVLFEGGIEKHLPSFKPILKQSWQKKSEPQARYTVACSLLLCGLLSLDKDSASLIFRRGYAQLLNLETT
jgi:hypothetical protein